MPPLDTSLDTFIANILSKPSQKRGRPKNTAPKSTPPSTPPSTPQLTPRQRIHLQRQRTTSPRWRTEALILLHRQFTCTNCGHIDSTTEPHIFLRKWHPQYGLHYARLTHYEATITYHTFPRREETTRERVPFCWCCFIPQETVTPNHQQLSFPLTEPPQPLRSLSEDEIPSLDHAYPITFTATPSWRS